MLDYVWGLAIRIAEIFDIKVSEDFQPVLQIDTFCTPVIGFTFLSFSNP